MTPDQLQQKIEFIIESQASSSARMDRVEANLAQHEIEHKHFTQSLALQKENIEGLMRVAQHLLDVAKAEREARKVELEAEREAREVELEAEREAREASHREHQQRIDSTEEITKVLREILEGRLRPPDKPSQES
jgi:hypothetical protein